MNNKEKIKMIIQLRRKKRVRAKLQGSALCPRLAPFRSHKHISAQIINDKIGATLISASDKDLKRISSKGKKIEIAFAVGELIAQRAKAAKIPRVAFDKGHYAYHGRVKALAEGARKGGLEF